MSHKRKRYMYVCICNTAKWLVALHSYRFGAWYVMSGGLSLTFPSLAGGNKSGDPVLTESKFPVQVWCNACCIISGNSYVAA